MQGSKAWRASWQKVFSENIFGQENKEQKRLPRAEHRNEKIRALKHTQEVFFVVLNIWEGVEPDRLHVTLVSSLALI